MGNESRWYYGCQLINSPHQEMHEMPFLCVEESICIYIIVCLLDLDLDYITKRLMVNTRDPYYLLRYNIRGGKTD